MKGSLTALFFNPQRLRAGWRVALFFGLFVSLTGISRFPLVALLLASWAMTRFVDRRPFASLGLALEPAGLRQAAWGAALGAGAMVALVGSFSIGPGLELVTRPWPGLGFAAVNGLSHFTIALLEELLLRGYVFQALIEGLGAVPAWALTSLGFGLLHLGNPELTPLALANLVLAGLLLGLLVLRTRSLWIAVGFHFAWNVVQGPVLGLPVSGIVFEESWLKVALQGPAWWSGGSFGPEGGGAVTLLLAGLLLWAWRTPRLRPGPRAYRLWRRGVHPARLEGLRRARYDEPARSEGKGVSP